MNKKKIVKVSFFDRRWRGLTFKEIIIFTMLGLTFGASVSFTLFYSLVRSPRSSVKHIEPTIKPTPCPTPTKNLDIGGNKPQVFKLVSAVLAKETGSWHGIASYYSRSGCLGCSKTLTMANGQPLNDNAFTVAFNRLPLGSKVRVINAKTMMLVYATVTDRGGFERLGRIIDITPAVKDQINCDDLCSVIVEEVL